MKRTQLKQLLTHDIPDLKDKSLLIWGTGDTACLYQEGLNRIDLGRKIIGYCDSNKTKWGKKFYGKPILAPSELSEYKNTVVLICSLQPHVNREIMSQLESLNIENYLIDEVILKIHHKDVLQCYDLLYDTESKRIFAELIKSRLSGINPNKNIISGDTYFIWRQIASQDIDAGTFIDCGAYVGDTIEKYIWYKDGVFNKIIAIEPDYENFHAMLRRKQRLCEEWNLKETSIELIQAGVGEKTADYYFTRSNNGLGSKFAESDDEGNLQKIFALDELINEPYSFLKADVESFEYKMLLGAKKGIQQWKPNLAISIYHNSVDLFSLAVLIHSFVPEYKIVLRHHLDTLAETVLYAWVDKQ